ncbi:sec-independent protein translocase protein TATA, chloroplastic-like isoform X1 [Olea europaea var. sylvestris]|uniref:sec-independent protein translocase protein TATA, chloroplastic-like isoform X1 n=1 Tax=Olea europaea var. sylvestris TaxID=158386 RepID=UPI000C1CF384|nr:sec-independent protein translocase protein TATA, chloroplastic-like isoform X1 [Olea europaea var. sylvestris]
MTTISTAAVASKLNHTPTTRFTTVFSSSSSVFFGDHISNQAGLRLVLDRPRRARTSGKRGLSCNCLFGLGVPELVVIAGVVALVFGPKKLPEVGRSIGKTVKSFQQAAKELESELKKDTESSEELPAEKITTVSEEEKQEAKVPSTKESSQV